LENLHKQKKPRLGNREPAQCPEEETEPQKGEWICLGLRIYGGLTSPGLTDLELGSKIKPSKRSDSQEQGSQERKTELMVASTFIVPHYARPTSVALFKLTQG
jgi:hypothetical protein